MDFECNVPLTLFSGPSHYCASGWQSIAGTGGLLPQFIHEGFVWTFPRTQNQLWTGRHTRAVLHIEMLESTKLLKQLLELWCGTETYLFLYCFHVNGLAFWFSKLNQMNECSLGSKSEWCSLPMELYMCYKQTHKKTVIQKERIYHLYQWWKFKTC